MPGHVRTTRESTPANLPSRRTRCTKRVTSTSPTSYDGPHRKQTATTPKLAEHGHARSSPVRRWVTWPIELAGNYGGGRRNKGRRASRATNAIRLWFTQPRNCPEPDLRAGGARPWQESARCPVQAARPATLTSPSGRTESSPPGQGPDLRDHHPERRPLHGVATVTAEQPPGNIQFRPCPPRRTKPHDAGRRLDRGP